MPTHYYYVHACRADDLLASRGNVIACAPARVDAVVERIENHCKLLGKRCEIFITATGVSRQMRRQAERLKAYIDG